MTKTELDLGIGVIKYTFDRLPMPQRIKLVEDLEKQTWPDRFKTMLNRIDRKAGKFPISEEEIDQSCEKVRHKSHANRSH